MTATEFLREKGILSENHTKWIITFSDRSEVDLVQLFDEFAHIKSGAKPEKPLSKDPYIDEVCSGRLLNAVLHCMNWTVPERGLPYPKVSECLGLKEELSKMRNVGTKTLHEYQQLIEKYGNS